MTLPGVTTTINDGGLRIQRTLSGDRLLLLGTTDNSALTINEPAVVQDVILAMSACRETGGNETELSLALGEALRGGAEFVEVCRIADTGSAALDYTGGGYTPSARYTDLATTYETLGGHETDIVVPVGAYAEDIPGDTLTTGDQNHGPYYTGGTHASNCFALQLAQFCYDQTVDFNSTIGIIGVKPPSLSPVTGSAITEAYLNGWAADTGDNGYWFQTPSRATLSAWAIYLTGNAAVDTATPWDAYNSGSSSAYATTYFPTWQANTAGGVGSGSGADDLSNPIDLGAYISVFAAPVRTSGSNVNAFAGQKSASRTNSTHVTDGSAAYAGLVSSLAVHSGTTNKGVPGLVQSRVLSSTQVEGLRDGRIVSMLDRSRGYVVAEDVTGAYYISKYQKSDFHRLTTTRITHEAVDNVRAAIEPYIGEGMSAPALNAMKESIENSLHSMVKAGALRRQSFQLLSSPDQFSLGEATVLLEIVPAFELTSVTVSVRLAKE